MSMITREVGQLTKEKLSKGNQTKLIILNLSILFMLFRVQEEHSPKLNISLSQNGLSKDQVSMDMEESQSKEVI